MSTRTDIHRPSAEEFDPAGYECEGCYDLHPDSLHSMQARVQTVIRLTGQGYSFSGVWGLGSCDHCGARVRYTALMSHPDSKGLIWIGEQCLNNRFGLTKSEFQKLRKDAALNAKRVKKADAIEALLNTSDDLRYSFEWALGRSVACGEIIRGEGETAYTDQKDWEECSSQEKTNRRNKDWRIAEDIAFKLRNYGSISEAQQRFLIKLWKDDAVKQARQRAEAARFEEGGDLQPCPAGRMEISGEIISVKFIENDFGGCTKILVRDERGFKVYGSRPAGIGWCEKGAKVVFTATVEPSQDDKGFGFYSRPAKAREVVQEGSELEPVG